MYTYIWEGSDWWGCWVIPIPSWRDYTPYGEWEAKVGVASPHTHTHTHTTPPVDINTGVRAQTRPSPGAPWCPPGDRHVLISGTVNWTCAVLITTKLGALSAGFGVLTGGSANCSSPTATHGHIQRRRPSIMARFGYLQVTGVRLNGWFCLGEGGLAWFDSHSAALWKFGLSRMLELLWNHCSFNRWLRPIRLLVMKVVGEESCD